MREFSASVFERRGADCLAVAGVDVGAGVWFGVPSSARVRSEVVKARACGRHGRARFGKHFRLAGVGLDALIKWRHRCRDEAAIVYCV